jgi:4-amino-4-deoxy-L-arabinose transferase
MQNRDKLLFSCSILLCVGLIYFYPLTLPTPLLDPDEGLHASISQEMVESRDYVVPSFLHTPFLDKPIFYFEMQALSLRYLGMNEAAVRLPGLLFGLLGAVSAAVLARRLFDDTTALLTFLVALTLIVPLALAQFATHDVALVPWTNSLLLCWWAATHEKSLRRRIAYTAGAALFAGLAVLTKGLIGVAIVFVGYSLYVALRRQHIMRFVICSTLSVLVGLLLASPWFLAMEWRTPGYLYYYFFERHVLGFVTHTQPHGNAPWYFYVPALVGGTAPWIFLALPGLWQSWRELRSGQGTTNGPTLLVLCWLLGGLVFLSVAKSKLITYALPLYPAIAISTGHSCRRFLEGELQPNIEKTFRRTFVACCIVGCMAPFGLLVGLDRYNHEVSPPMAYFVACIATSVMFGALLLLRRARPAAALAIGTLWFPLLFVVIMTWPMQAIAKLHSQRQLAFELRSQGALPDHIELVGSRVASLIFYLEPGQRQVLHAGQIVEVQTDIARNWSTLPPHTLLAAKTSSWNRCLQSPMKLRCHGVMAGDYYTVENR